MELQNLYEYIYTYNSVCLTLNSVGLWLLYKFLLYVPSAVMLSSGVRIADFNNVSTMLPAPTGRLRRALNKAPHVDDEFRLSQ